MGGYDSPRSKKYNRKIIVKAIKLDEKLCIACNNLMKIPLLSVDLIINISD